MPPFSTLQFRVTPGDTSVLYGDPLDIRATVGAAHTRVGAAWVRVVAAARKKARRNVSILNDYTHDTNAR